jgi:Cd2+/Zn2+-exporting ATPase
MSDTLSTSRTPTADRLRETMEPALTQKERLNLGWRVGSALAATALLVVGWLYEWAFPDQQDVASLVLFVGALIAGLPVFQAAIRGLRAHTCATEEVEAPEAAHVEHDHAGHDHAGHDHAGHDHLVIDRLVSVAVLAAIASGDYSTAILVPLFIAVSHFLEERSVLGAKAAIEGLKHLHARSATLLREDGSEESVAVAQLRPGDRILVRPGEILPADARVRVGYSAIDQSAVTGEAVPEDVGPGSRVFAGTVNVSGLLEAEVVSVGDQTAMGRVLEMLREAERSQAPITQLLERYAGHYLPFALLVALVTLLVSREVGRTVAVLVASCPCALVLSSSTAMIAALALASRYGILIKSTRFLEVLAEVRTLVLDKTGTVTLGHLDVVAVLPADGVDEDELVGAALSCAQGSRHPISRAIAAAAHQRGLAIAERPSVTEHPGKGVEAWVDGRVVRLGSAAWLGLDGQAPGGEARAAHGARPPGPPQHARRSGQQEQVPSSSQPSAERRAPSAFDAPHVGPVVWVARDGQVLGAVLLADRPRPEAQAALIALRGLGITRMVLLTGDGPEVARETACHLGIQEWHARLLPDQKLEIVSRMVDAGEGVLAVGDGVNDAPALARADVGVAMGAMGTDTAIQSADIALMSNDIRRLGTAIRLSRLTRRTINANVAMGLGTALAMLALAAFGYVNAIAAALLHNVGSVAVVLNSARLLRCDLDEE